MPLHIEDLGFRPVLTESVDELMKVDLCRREPPGSDSHIDVVIETLSNTSFGSAEDYPPPNLEESLKEGHDGFPFG